MEQPVRFYLGTGADAELVAELDMGYDAEGVFRYFTIAPDEDSYQVSEFRATVASLAELYPAFGGPADVPAWQVAYVTNAVHVFHDGYLVSHLYPRGVRKRTAFPVGSAT